eukprot:TRINITY_DN21702_c0_g2_i1.p1 TRINITY_DN21702_c0_g2~~TRINITY_DN21702_c0_g2_i1.p1  ORF type:complete len:148 (+),score=42.48 TRINITY_DN21702_c0_g2_i1:79-522(+)
MDRAGRTAARRSFEELINAGPQPQPLSFLDAALLEQEQEHVWVEGEEEEEEVEEEDEEEQQHDGQDSALDILEEPESPHFGDYDSPSMEATPHPLPQHAPPQLGSQVPWPTEIDEGGWSGRVALERPQGSGLQPLVAKVRDQPAGLF